jgi:hypothetical protein
MVCIQDQRVAGREAERILVFFLGKHSVGGAQLFYDAGIEPRSLFELGGNQQPLSLFPLSV